MIHSYNRKTRFRSLTNCLCCIVVKETKILFNLDIYILLGGRKKHPIAICLMLITELVCVVTLMREWTGLRIFGMTTAQCILKAIHMYVRSAVTQSHVADFDF